MDGASKFVKGDAIAAIVIVLINLIGGFAVGILQKHMSFGDAIQTYSLLTVGDGLVAQIPALLISLSSGLIVTRAATRERPRYRPARSSSRATSARCSSRGGAICAHRDRARPAEGPVLLVGGAAPHPRDPASRARRRSLGQAAAAASRSRSRPRCSTRTRPSTLASDMRVEPLELEIAFDLVDLVDASKGGDLLDRVRALRRKLALELGIVIPLVRTRDNLELPASTYAIRVHGVEVGRGEAPPGPRARARRRQPGASRASRPASRCSGSRRRGCRSSSGTRPRSRARRSSTARR